MRWEADRGLKGERRSENVNFLGGAPEERETPVSSAHGGRTERDNGGASSPICAMRSRSRRIVGRRPHFAVAAASGLDDHQSTTRMRINVSTACLPACPHCQHPQCSNSSARTLNRTYYTPTCAVDACRGRAVRRAHADLHVACADPGERRAPALAALHLCARCTGCACQVPAVAAWWPMRAMWWPMSDVPWPVNKVNGPC